MIHTGAKVRRHEVLLLVDVGDVAAVRLLADDLEGGNEGGCRDEPRSGTRQGMWCFGP